MGTLDGKVVVVTGASSGIGREAARQLSAEGARVVLTARARAPLEAAAADCGGETLVHPADVRDQDAVHALAAAAVERFGRLDVWVNCAGLMAYGRFEDVPADVFRAVVDTNLFGQVHGARAALPVFRRQGEGVLVNMGSLWGRVTTPDVSSYVTSKFALRAFTEVLHQELRHEPRIGVALILPQAVDTPIFERSGNYSGRSVRPIAPVLDPETVAAGIVACAREPKREVTYRVLGRALELLHAVAPPLYHRTMPTAFETGNYGDGQVAPGPGAVLDPAAGGHAVHGGWKAGRRRDLARAFLGAAVGGVRGLLRG